MRCPRCGELIPAPPVTRRKCAPCFWLLVGLVIALMLGVIGSVVRETGTTGKGLARGFQEVFRAFTPQGRDQARAQECAGRMRSLVLATMMYRHDWDGRMPPLGAWEEQIAPYLSEPAAMICPSVPAQMPSYGYNKALASHRDEEAEMPWRVVMIFEARPECASYGDIKDLAIPPRHRGGNNFAFLDGQVRQLKLGENLLWTVEATPSKAPEPLPYPPAPGLPPEGTFSGSGPALR